MSATITSELRRRRHRPRGGAVQTNLRLSRGLRQQLRREAKKRGVSMNYEINWRLRRSLVSGDTAEVDSLK